MPQERPPIGRKFRLKGKVYIYDKATGKMVEKKPENEYGFINVISDPLGSLDDATKNSGGGSIQAYRDSDRPSSRGTQISD